MVNGGWEVLAGQRQHAAPAPDEWVALRGLKGVLMDGTDASEARWAAALSPLFPLPVLVYLRATQVTAC